MMINYMAAEDNLYKCICNLEVILNRSNFMIKRSANSEKKKLIKMADARSTAEPVTAALRIMGQTDLTCRDWADFDAARRENFTIILVYLYCPHPLCVTV
jgi:hypothetical protein